MSSKLIRSTTPSVGLTRSTELLNGAVDQMQPSASRQMPSGVPSPRSAHVRAGPSDPSAAILNASIPLPAGRAAVIRRLAPEAFSVERVDTLDSDPALRQALWQSPRDAFAQTWRKLITERPGLYLSHRLAVFGQVLLTPDLKQCLPVIVGVVSLLVIGVSAWLLSYASKVSARNREREGAMF